MRQIVCFTHKYPDLNVVNKTSKSIQVSGVRRKFGNASHIPFHIPLALINTNLEFCVCFSSEIDLDLFVALRNAFTESTTSKSNEFAEKRTDVEESIKS